MQEEPGESTLKALVAYRGAPFSGFARQPGQCTVQGEIERALEVLFKREVETTCAGRTDAGVHALGQVISFNLSNDEISMRSLKTLQRSLNALINDHIAVSDLSEAPFGFSARFDALSREYRYFFSCESVRPVLAQDLMWHVPCTLDIAAMKEAAEFLIGEHDFKSFCTAASAVGKPTKRNILSIDIYPETLMGQNVFVIKVIGNAFLHSMVRTLVGTLLEVGKGNKLASWVKDVLKACDRGAAGQTAPAQGLVLWRVRYKHEEAL